MSRVLPQPGELPEVEVDPSALRHLADAQMNVELDTGDMVLNIGPQHPATHGTLRLESVSRFRRFKSARISPAC